MVALVFKMFYRWYCYSCYLVLLDLVVCIGLIGCCGLNCLVCWDCCGLYFVAGWWLVVLLGVRLIVCFAFSWLVSLLLVYAVVLVSVS